LPLKVAVIVPALKLPDASRATIALAVLALAAVVFAFGRTPLTSPVARSTASVVEPTPMNIEAVPGVEPPVLPPEETVPTLCTLIAAHVVVAGEAGTWNDPNTENTPTGRPVLSNRYAPSLAVGLSGEDSVAGTVIAGHDACVPVTVQVTLL
jgi:hypothetical protein